jgi:Molecular chaperone (small heat shock protein)
MYSTFIPEQILRSFVGIEDAVSNDGNHPPHDIVRLNDTTWVVGIAAAGFGKDDITVTQQQNRLIVSGRKDRTHYHELANEFGSDEPEYLYQRLARRAWERTFRLMEDIRVERAEYVDGVLYVILKRIVPEEKQPRRIEIR